MPLAACLLLTACQTTSASGYKVECRLQPAPLYVGTARVQVNVIDSHQRSVQNAEVSLEANMSHPGMQPVFAAATPSGGSSYQAKMNFEMPGDWTLLIHANLPDGGRLDSQQNFTVQKK